MDWGEIGSLIPQLATWVAVTIAGVYTVVKLLRQDDEWKKIVEQKDRDLAALRVERDELRKERDSLEDEVATLRTKRLR